MKKPLTEIIQNPEARENLERRFWPKVVVGADTDCWPWVAKARHPYGYGRMTAGRGVHLKAHQIAWSLKNGPIPIGLLVLHSCDNPSCCNPSHLSVGTQKANMAGAKERGRSLAPPVHKGEANHNSKLTNKQIAAIRADQRSAEAIAVDYGISSKTVYRIRWGKRTET